MKNREDIEILSIASLFGYFFSLKDLLNVLGEDKKQELLVILGKYIAQKTLIPSPHPAFVYSFKDKKTETFYKKEAEKLPNHILLKIIQYQRYETQKLNNINENIQASIKKSNHVILELSKNAVIQEGKIEKASQLITQTLSKYINSSRVSIWIYKESPELIECIDLYEKKDKTHHQGTILYAKDFPRYFNAIKNDEFVKADDALSHPSTSEFKDVYLNPLGIKSLLDIPFYVADSLKGVTCFEHYKLRKWEMQEILFASSVSTLITLAFQAMVVKEIQETLHQTNQELINQNEAIEGKQKLLTKQNKKMKANESILRKAFEQMKANEQELQRKNEILVAQEDELRQNMEELKITQDAMKNKQLLLEDTNQQLKNKEQILSTAYTKIKESEEQTKSINEILKNQSKQLEIQNQRMKSSIDSAKTIQQAILPYQEKMDMLLKDYFVIYKPKDVVSGDFYWLNEHEHKTILLVADCTGHGVPGAFMTLIANTLVDKIVRVWDITSPAKILTRLHEEVRTVLRQDETQNNNGLDASLITIEKLNTKEYQIVFAGAKNDIYYIPVNSTEVLELKGTRKAIGGIQNEDKEFENQEFIFTKNTHIYLGSDGLVDQNNIKRKKIGAKKLKRRLLANIKLSMQAQGEELEKLLKEYMIGTLQRDDILWMGIRL